MSFALNKVSRLLLYKHGKLDCLTWLLDDEKQEQEESFPFHFKLFVSKGWQRKRILSILYRILNYLVNFTLYMPLLVREKRLLIDRNNDSYIVIINKESFFYFSFYKSLYFFFNLLVLCRRIRKKLHNLLFSVYFFLYTKRFSYYMPVICLI